MASLSIKAHPQVRQESAAAFDYYLERNIEAALNFLAELEEAEHAIQQQPEAWPKYLFGTWHYLLKRYPYVVVYRVKAEHIEILAIAHGSRQSGYWADRIGDAD
jgi:plasmid stabilization system protein ParE